MGNFYLTITTGLLRPNIIGRQPILRKNNMLRYYYGVIGVVRAWTSDVLPVTYFKFKKNLIFPI